MRRSILFINDSLQGGGVEIVLRQLTWRLSDFGDKITIWASGGDRKALLEKYPFGVRFYRLPFWNGASKRFTLKWFFQRACRVLFEGFFLKLKRWDAVIAFKEGPSMRLASKLRGRKKLAWVHTDFEQFHWSRCNFHSDGEEFSCMRSFDKLVCVSNAARDSLVRTMGDPGNLCVRYNPIDYRRIISSAAAPTADCIRPAGKPLFISVGRLSEIKRYDMLIDICAELEKEFAFELWIVGGGELEEELREKLRRDNVKSVRLLGKRDNPYPYMVQADWAVSSSASESYGLTVQEALVLGVPVIASHCPAIAETLDSRFGIIVGSDKDALKSGMRRLLSNPDAAANYRDNIRRYYDRSCLWDDRIQDILSLLDI